VAKYVVDTDTGVDDAMAILQILAARKKNQVNQRNR
jgi:inosine-uridine nucleoside N-ribohydrolase